MITWTSKTYKRVSHHYPNNIVQARGIFVSTIDAKITPVHANETVRKKSSFSSVVYVVSPTKATEINLNEIKIYLACSAHQPMQMLVQT